jgi:hypothetical protein
MVEKRSNQIPHTSLQHHTLRIWMFVIRFIEEKVWESVSLPDKCCDRFITSYLSSAPSSWINFPELELSVPYNSFVFNRRDTGSPRTILM